MSGGAKRAGQGARPSFTMSRFRSEFDLQALIPVRHMRHVNARAGADSLTPGRR